MFCCFFKKRTPVEPYSQPPKANSPKPEAEDLFDKNLAMMNAAKAGDFKQVKQLLCDGAKTDIVDPQGNTALHWMLYQAKSKMDLICCSKLFNTAELRKVNAKGLSPLLFAIKAGNYNAVRMLWFDFSILLNSDEIPASQNIWEDTDYQGQTALHLAIRCKNTELVKFLLEYGPKNYYLNAKNRDQKTAIEMTRELLIDTKPPPIETNEDMAAYNLQIARLVAIKDLLEKAYTSTHVNRPSRSSTGLSNSVHNPIPEAIFRDDSNNTDYWAEVLEEASDLQPRTGPRRSPKVT